MRGSEIDDLRIRLFINMYQVKLMLRFLKRYWPSCIVVLIILYATWVPKPIDPNDLPKIPHIDKLMHAVLMGGLLGALLFDYRRAMREHTLTRRTVMWFALGVCLFSVVDEVVQGLLPIGRPSDFYDLLADWFGVIIAALTAPRAVNAVVKK